MATSGSTNFSSSRDSLITDAMVNVGAISEGVTPTAAQLAANGRILNMLVKQWAAKLGMPLWAMKTGYILPQSDTNSMLVSSHVVTSYIQTTLSTAAAAAATVLVPTSTTGMTIADVIGVELTDGTVQYSTITALVPFTIADALASAAAAGGEIYTYTTTNRVSRPLRVVYANTHDAVSNVDTPITIIAHSEFNDIGTKTSESYPTQLYYDPQLVGKFYWYPRWIDGKKVVQFRFHRPFEDFDAAADEPDFPQEWHFPLLWYLSWAICPKFGIPMETRAQWLQEANMLAKEVSDMGQEEGSLFLNPVTR